MTGVEGYRGSVERVWKILDEEVGILGGDSSKVFVVGHCQGCMLAFKAGLSYSKTLGGVIGLMGYARTDNILQAPANSETPVLSVIGGLDLLCPQNGVQKSHKQEGLYDRKNFVQEVWPLQNHHMNEDIHKRVAAFVEKYL
jgi:predicted esterase